MAATAPSSTTALSAAQVVKRMAPAARAAWWAKLSEADRIALAYAWDFWSRPDQRPPPWAWFVWFICAGRGWGKTRVAAEWIQGKANAGGVGGRILLAGRTSKDVRETMLEGESGLITIGPPHNRARYVSSRGRVEWPSGVIGVCFSADEPESFRGPQHHFGWCDELAAWRYGWECWDQLRLGMRLGDAPQIVVSTTPKPTRIIRDLAGRHGKTVHMTTGSTYDNLDNLAPTFKDEVLSQYEGTRLGSQELYGNILADIPGALWKRDQFDAEGFRVTQAPPLIHCITFVDPSIKSGKAHEGDKASDDVAMAGIVTVGASEAGRYYVIADDSLRDRPFNWAGQAITAYNRHKADMLGYEDNQGGEMTDDLIKVIDGTVATVAVNARRNKYIRAEPMAALYERHLVHHVGRFDALEDELCNFDPTSNQPSPNRLDALVHALTWLHTKVAKGKKQKRVNFTGQSPTRPAT